MRGMGRIFPMPNSRFPWIAYNHRGKEYRETAGAAIREIEKKNRRKVSADEARKVAQNLLKQRLKETGADSLGLRAFVGPQQDRLLVKDLLDDLEADFKLRQIKGLRPAASHLDVVRRALGDVRAVELTTATVNKFINQRLEAKKKPATINRETGMLRAALRLAFRRRQISSVLEISKLREDNARQGFFEQAEFEAVGEHMPECLKGFAHFGYCSGWRKSEISSLLWEDVDRLGRIIRLRSQNSKNGIGRMLALEGELWDIIERQWQARQYEQEDGTVAFSRYVFHRDGARIGDIRKAWASACKKAAVDGRLFHDLRRTAVRNMIRAGVPERVSMSISGHKTRAIFDRYNIVSEDDLRQAVQKTQSYLKGAPSKTKVVSIGKKVAGGSR